MRSVCRYGLGVGVVGFIVLLFYSVWDGKGQGVLVSELFRSL